MPDLEQIKDAVSNLNLDQTVEFRRWWRAVAPVLTCRPGEVDTDPDSPLVFADPPFTYHRLALQATNPERRTSSERGHRAHHPPSVRFDADVRRGDAWADIERRGGVAAPSRDQRPLEHGQGRQGLPRSSCSRARVAQVAPSHTSRRCDATRGVLHRPRMLHGRRPLALHRRRHARRGGDSAHHAA